MPPLKNPRSRAKIVAPKKPKPSTEGLFRFLRVTHQEKLPKALSKGQKSSPQAYHGA